MEKATLVIPVDFLFNYNEEDCIIDIKVDLQTLEDRISKNITKALTDYVKVGQKIKRTIVKNSNGDILWYENFGKNGEIISKYKPQDLEVIEYDDNGNISHVKLSYGYESYWEYDDRGNIIKLKELWPNMEEWNEEESEYDKNNNCIHYKNSHYEEWAKYDDNNNRIYFKHGDCETFTEYDHKGNIIKNTDKFGIAEYKYDDYGNMTYSKDDDGELFYEYEFY